MNRYNDEMDKILHEQISNIKIEGFSKDEIQEMIFKAKQRQKVRKIKLYKMAACFVLLILASFVGIASCVINKSENANTIIQGNIDNNNKETKEYVVYSKIEPNATASRVIPTTKEIYDLSEVVVIAKVDNVDVINYDNFYNNEEKQYTFVRTIGNVTVLNTIKGNFNKGDSIELRKKGGKIKYKSILDYYEACPNISRDIEMNKECQELIDSGKNINDIYTDVSVGFKNINIEKGKTYLVHLTQKSSGQWWVQADENGIREYNEENDTVLNNKTGEWEKLDYVKDIWEMGE